MSTEIPSFINGRFLQNCTMYTSQQTDISIDFPNVRIHDSGVVSPMGIQFHSEQYQNPNVGCHDLVDAYAAGNVISDSKYRIPAQQLLNELVNVEKVKQHFKHELMNDSQQVFGESKNQQGSTSLSPAKKKELKSKMTKLSSMLNEVDKRHKQYYHQMQILVSSFDVVAGIGASKPYTSRALQTISTHFRCLRDAINNQIKLISRSLGETDTNENGIVISRLRFVDQQLRKQNLVKQFGPMQEHVWRPQRGLPESCVSILRAWLFEHFLHPYPKDSEKTVLAKQTGLTRSQLEPERIAPSNLAPIPFWGHVSNWFINARVRLWKPMVEEIYQEESAEAAMDSNSSSEIPLKESSRDQAQNMNLSAASSYQPHETKLAFPDVDENILLRNPITNEGVSLTLRLQHCKNRSLPNLSFLEGHHHSLVNERDVNCNAQI